MIVGLLGILKAGGAYVPVDPDYPLDRIAYILADSKATIVVTDMASRSRLERIGHTAKIVCLDQQKSLINQCPIDALATRIKPSQLAYIIYTSGSTGKPKGVMIEHTNVVSLLKMDAPLFTFNEEDVWTLFHSFCFDFSVWEMYGALLNGGRLIVVPKAIANDAKRFNELLIEQGVTVLNQTPSAFYALQEHLVEPVRSLPLRYVIFGGEALHPAKLLPFNQTYPSCHLINMYGITETTVHVTFLELQPHHLSQSLSLIGQAIPTLTTYILNDTMRPIVTGETGELYVGGAGVARGYLNQPTLTAERFVLNPFSSRSGDRLYRSGDLVQLLADGTMAYQGRIDNQVKIRGYRIELGEIEQALQQCTGVKQAVVLAQTYAESDVRLIGYVLVDGPFQKQVIRDALQRRLPEYMIPGVLIPIEAIPLTSNGKVDRRALPMPDPSATLLDAYMEPGNPTEKKLTRVWKTILTVNQVGAVDNFFELGGNSLLANRMVVCLKQEYALDVSVTKLYQFPTIRLLAAYLDGQTQEKHTVTRSLSAPPVTTAVAIIGMAGRFPGANSVDALWDVLRAGKETIQFFSPEQLDSSLPESVTQDVHYVKARGILDQADQFDAVFFGINERLAEVMDPQQRIFLEIAWEALEQAGYIPQRYEGRIGIWAGCGNNTYYLNNVLPNKQVLDQVGSFQAMTVNEKDFIASRTAYQLNLDGPAVSVFSACSTSLLAVAQAVDSIRLGHCELALAGGASITAPIFSGHLYEEGAMLSRDGHCRPFDAKATGTVFSDGAGVVLLKSLEAAQHDGDTVYAVIKGTGVNNDGRVKGSFTAPSAEGQAGAIRMALADANIEADTLSYLEAHGTATPLGDPIEIKGLSMAFGQSPQKQFCAIGSIKSNLGHLTAAAGVTGLIKVALSLHHRQLPASLAFETPNPVIDFTNSPFYVNTVHQDWTSTGPRRAGVSSFGVGGTNVHVVLEEYTHPEPVAIPPAANRPHQLVVWSAKTKESLAEYKNHLTDHLHQPDELAIADLANTLQNRHPGFAFRQFVVAASTADLRHALKAPATPQTSNARPELDALPEFSSEVVFLFPGQGAQHLNMGRELYQNEPVYRRAIDECADYLTEYLDTDIRTVLYADEADLDATERLKNTCYTQPALFVTEYARAVSGSVGGLNQRYFVVIV